MKSFFDFIGRTEATRGARRWSWIKKTPWIYPQLNNLINSNHKKGCTIIVHPESLKVF
ncbi:hypothetical protein G3A_19860 [Bacillus sp. 17376]|uniref:hypothetical protein n=1 Tax=Mesobacillus boroniphilus TaxID=308892 RepID=UPI0003C7B430|nr:hypothetical protein [Mesobacillus boroniphilus]ESU30871.1 hypothetical protein G3A_19860 [Bacillus sp. 17376]